MKSSYELAMERLNKNAPTVTLTAAQKKDIAELESKYAAKFAERELFLKEEIAKAVNAGKFEDIEQIEKQLVSARKSIQAELEEKKAKVRDDKSK
jgi:molybdopterin converting factor small subunit